MGEIDIDDREYAAAIAQGVAEQSTHPVPVSVRYDPASGRVVVEFENGAVFMAPTANLEGLAEASQDDLAQVELLGETGLHWPTLDVDLTISGLMHGIFGTARFMEMSRRGGQSRSAAKATAARENGKRGGRPRKTS
jgi:hypothetical protein